ncbi:hypothetical protein A8L34_10690 [Bacillus sp. FJAT-27264]|uniref:hypothetical protein n=1 Tax=Paenibacillus sp. (strain DSM 101736 / FJAT-27264) TaxID=1850362 RepID=UPI0008081377|nr:hypothetical protein [Bacillus sp. FJAT-27264]OBZ14400.1 hypothetical protein A8L34_10690 [Bacillus sp. FJAT-27264]
MDEKKDELALVDIKKSEQIQDEISKGKAIMDYLEDLGIKIAEFENGTYFSKKKKSRSLSTRNIILTETEDELIVRMVKSGTDMKKLNLNEPPKATQKMLGAYNGVSQSTVSKNKDGKKEKAKKKKKK